jgi:hypothetical protein
MSKQKYNRLLARIISRVLDPILIIPLLLTLSAWNAFHNGQRWRFLTLLILLDAVLPGLVLVYFVEKHKIGSGWDIQKRAERLPIFVFVIFCHLAGVLIAWFLGKYPLAQYLTSFWILALMFALITLKWKISVHVGVLSALATFLILTRGFEWLWMFALVAMVAWARITNKNHTWEQALAGGVLPALVLPVCFVWLGIK